MNPTPPPAAAPPARDAPLSTTDAPTDGRETGAACSPTRGPGTAGLSDVLLAHHLDEFALDRELVDETTSTNADLTTRARAGAPSRPVLRVAQRQTQGRGRRGRRWHGSAGGSLLFSLALPWRRLPADSAAVTLACGLAVACALQEHLAYGGDRIRVKWPNDILLDDGKLAGILVEMAEDPTGARTLVMGMGFNLVSDTGLRARVAGEAPADVAGPAAGPATSVVPVADLASLLGATEVLAQREVWLARLAKALLAAARQFESAGFAGGPAAFAARCAYLNTAVTVHAVGSPALAGILRGVDGQGRLLVESAHGLQALSSGDVSVRSRGQLWAGAAGDRR